MYLYFGGAEVPSHRKLFIDNHISDVYMSYVGLARRVEFKRPWLIKDKFPEDMNVLLDSGAFTYNKPDAETDLNSLADVANAYHAFVAANIERVVAVTEFDALALGIDWLRGVRADFYDYFGDKFMPVWHAEYGTDELENLATKYKRVGILQTELGDKSLVPMLNMFAARRGTLFHGLAMTKPDVMREVRWDSVGSTSWTSPMHFGDTQIWTGRELKRYTNDQKAQARKRHRTLFTNAGFDAQKIADDDTAEVAKLTFWSWQQLLSDINRHKAFTVATHQAETSIPGTADVSDDLVAQAGEDLRNAQLTPRVAQEREHEVISPVFRVTDQGLQINSKSLRLCDECFLKDRGCPGYQPGAECKFEFAPFQVSTPELIDQVENTIIQLQMQRIEFMKMAEDIEGGYVDPNLSNEEDRLMRFIKMKREGKVEKFSMNVNVTRQPGETSPLDLFGGDVIAAQQPHAEIMEADVVDDG